MSVRDMSQSGVSVGRKEEKKRVRVNRNKSQLTALL